MRKSKKIPFKPNPVIAFLVEGETEVWYLQMLKRNERHIKFDIKPEIPQKKRLSEQYSKVRELADYYDLVFWMVDLDCILAESKKVKRGKQKPIDKFSQMKQKLLNDFDNVRIIINQPCFEFWLLIHFINIDSTFTKCCDAVKKLQKHLPDYSKTQSFFTKQNNDIYLRLKDSLQYAIANAKSLKGFDSQNPYRGCSEMYKLFEEINLN